MIEKSEVLFESELAVIQPPAETAEIVEKDNMWRRVAGSMAGVIMSAGVMIAPQVAEALDHSDETTAVAVDTQRAEKKLRRCPKIIAHRGSVGKMHKPGKDFTTENTVWATRRAQMLGADGGEVDVRDSADYTSWLMHNGTVDETTNGHGPISNLRDWQIEKLRTPDGSEVPKYEDGEYLNDILSTGWANTRHRPQRLKANILNWRHQLDTKRVSNLPDYVRTTHEIIRARQGVNPSRVIMWATDVPRVARKIHSIDPDARIGRIFYTGRPSQDMIRTVGRQGSIFTSFNVHESQVERGWVKDAHQAGMEVLARTVNSLATARDVIEDNVDTIVSDNVGVVNAWNLERKGICKAVRKNMPVITPPEPTPTPTPTPTETPTPTPSETPTSSAPVEQSPSDAATLSEASTSPTGLLYTISPTP